MPVRKKEYLLHGEDELTAIAPSGMSLDPNAPVEDLKKLRGRLETPVEFEQRTGSTVLFPHEFGSRITENTSDLSDAEIQERNRRMNVEAAIERGWQGQRINYPTSQTGESGVNVGALQEGLKNLGYKVKPDEQYGEKTRQAVEAFQKEKGLANLGGYVADPMTQAAINRELFERQLSRSTAQPAAQGENLPGLVGGIRPEVVAPAINAPVKTAQISPAQMAQNEVPALPPGIAQGMPQAQGVPSVGGLPGGLPGALPVGLPGIAGPRPGAGAVGAPSVDRGAQFRSNIPSGMENQIPAILAEGAASIWQRRQADFSPIERQALVERQRWQYDQENNPDSAISRQLQSELSGYVQQMSGGRFKPDFGNYSYRVLKEQNPHLVDNLIAGMKPQPINTNRGKYLMPGVKLIDPSKYAAIKGGEANTITKVIAQGQGAVQGIDEIKHGWTDSNGFHAGIIDPKTGQPRALGINSPEAAAIQGKFMTMLMKQKEIFGLGVINGPDMTILSAAAGGNLGSLEQWVKNVFSEGGKWGVSGGLQKLSALQRELADIAEKEANRAGAEFDPYDPGDKNKFILNMMMQTGKIGSGGTKKYESGKPTDSQMAKKAEDKGKQIAKETIPEVPPKSKIALREIPK